MSSGVRPAARNDRTGVREDRFGHDRVLDQAQQRGRETGQAREQRELRRERREIEPEADRNDRCPGGDDHAGDLEVQVERRGEGEAGCRDVGHGDREEHPGRSALAGIPLRHEPADRDQCDRDEPVPDGKADAAVGIEAGRLRNEQVQRAEKERPAEVGEHLDDRDPGPDDLGNGRRSAAAFRDVALVDGRGQFGLRAAPARPSAGVTPCSGR